MKTYSETSVSFLPKLANFSYSEYSNERKQLEEEGFLTGLDLKLDFEKDLWTFYSLAGLSKGQVNYQGRTQLGSSLNTKTDQRITQYEFGIYRQLPSNFYASASLAQFEWLREIQARGQTQGLNERYHWKELSTGLGYNLKINKKQHIKLEAGLSKSLSPYVSVDLKRLNLGEPNLDLKEKYGYDFQLSHIYSYHKDWFLFSSFMYKYYEFGASESLGLSAGTRVFSVREPDSKTKIATFTIGVVRKY